MLTTLVTYPVVWICNLLDYCGSRASSATHKRENAHARHPASDCRPPPADEVEPEGAVLAQVLELRPSPVAPPTTRADSLPCTPRPQAPQRRLNRRLRSAHPSSRRPWGARGTSASSENSPPRGGGARPVSVEKGCRETQEISLSLWAGRPHTESRGVEERRAARTEDRCPEASTGSRSPATSATCTRASRTTTTCRCSATSFATT